MVVRDVDPALQPGHGRCCVSAQGLLYVDAIGGIAGARFGAVIAHRVSDRQLKVAFGVLLVIVSVRLLLP